MALIADDLGADSPKVALLQLLRVIVILSVFPTLFKHICFFTPNKKIKETKNRTSDQGSNGLNSEQPLVQADIKTDEDRESSNTEEIQQETSNEYEIGKHKGVNLFFTLCIASLGGMIGITFNIPAGAMIISMVAVVVFNLSCKKAYFPGSLRIITQAATGALIGSRMTRTDLLGLDDIIIPAIVMIFGMLLLTLIIGYAIHKLCKFDLVTALLASTPGGLQEISIIAEDFGADAPKVAVLHLFRLVTVISLFPILLRYVCMHFV
jgi:membrane AbrB-like protein